MAEETTKTFSQEQLDAIVSDRLARERAKYQDYEDLKTKAAEYDKAQEASKTELQKAQEKSAKLQTELETMKKTAELREIREKVSSKTGVPIELLTGGDEESCNKQAESILKFAKGNKYPGVKGSEGTSKKTGAQSESEEEYRQLANRIFGKKE